MLQPPAAAKPADAALAAALIAAASPYLVDPLSLRDAATDFPGQGTVQLYHLRFERALANGLSAQVVQRIYQLRDATAADLFVADDLQYDSSRNHFLLWRAQVIRDRAVLADAAGSDGGDLYPGAGGNESRQIRLPALQAGDRIDLVYLLLPNPGDWSWLDGHLLGDLFAFQDSYPTDQVVYVLTAPRMLAVSQVRLAPARLEHGAAGFTWIWQADRQPAFLSQPDGPSITDQAPFVQISGFDSWADLAGWYASLLDRRSQVPAAVSRRLLALAAPSSPATRALPVAMTSDAAAAGTRRTVDRVWQALAPRLGYRGDETGMHAYVPAGVADVLRGRAGDCKDGALLLVTWLRDEGVPAYLALVRTNVMGAVAPPGPDGRVAATLAAFDHALVYVPALRQWIDTTAPDNLSSELPVTDQNALALIVRPGQNQLVRIPSASADDNLTVRNVRLTPAAPGWMQAHGDIEIHGADAPGWRLEYAHRSRQRAEFESWLRTYYPGARVTAVAVAGVDPSAGTVRLQFTATVPAIAAPAMAWTPRHYAAQLASQPERNDALYLPLRWVTDESWSLSLASQNACAVYHDAPVDMRSAFGELEISSTCRNGLLQVQTRVSQTASQVLPGQYAEFRAFWQSVDGRLDAPLSDPGATAASPPLSTPRAGAVVFGNIR